MAIELLHITERALWESARATGTYTMSTRGKTLDEVGFIHCSFPHQLRGVAELLYGTEPEPGELVVLVIDRERLDVPVRVEPGEPGASGGEEFPHLYGPLAVAAVTEVRDWPRPQERSQKERMLAGDLYLADDPELTADALRGAALAERYNASSVTDLPARRALLGELLGEVGEDVVVRPPLSVDYGQYVSIGARTFVNVGAVLLDVAPIRIGEDVQIGPNVQLLTPTHPLDPEPRRAKWEAAKPITIGDNVWLGGGVIVCPGVTIGANTVVGAGSVVTRDQPPDVVAVGNPARVVRKTGEAGE
jgi:maltose O-acetyltransferase